MQEKSDKKRSLDVVGEPISAFIDFIKELFQSKGIYLPDRAYSSLFLAIWSLTLIWLISKQYLDPYYTVYGLIAYFFLYLLANWSWAQNLFMKVLNRPAYDIKLLKEDKIEHTKVALIIKRLAINNPQEAIRQIKDLIKRGRFKEDIQIALVSQYYKYSTEFANYIEGLILSEKKITPKTVGLFLLVSAKNLPDDFLDNLYKIHHESKSFLFNLGRSHIYVKIEDELENKYYNAGYQFKNFRKLTNYGTILAIILSGIIFFGLFYQMRNYVTPPYLIGMFYIMFFSYFVIILLIGKTRNYLDKKKAKVLLKTAQIELPEVGFDKFINELNIG